MEYYYVSIVIENDFGVFKGKKNKLDKEGLSKLKKLSQLFYTQNGFELDCEDGTFLVIPPDIIKKSILKIIYNKI